MAEALFRKYGGDRYAVYSAGVEPKGINPYTVRVMEEVRLSLADHRSKDVREYLGKEHFAHVFTVCHHAEQNCPSVFLTMGTHDHWDLDDPARAGRDRRGEACQVSRRTQPDRRAGARLAARAVIAQGSRRVLSVMPSTPVRMCGTIWVSGTHDLPAPTLDGRLGRLSPAAATVSLQFCLLTQEDLPCNAMSEDRPDCADRARPRRDRSRLLSAVGGDW